MVADGTAISPPVQPTGRRARFARRTVQPMRRVAGVLVVVLAAGCSSSAGGAEPDASVCVQALDAADQGFTDLAANIRVVQEALRQAFAGDFDAGQSTLAGVQRVDSAEYKRLEQECRDAVG